MPFARVGDVLVHTSGAVEGPDTLTGLADVVFTDTGATRRWVVSAGIAFGAGQFALDVTDGGPREEIVIDRSGVGLGVIGVEFRDGCDFTLGNRTSQGTDPVSSGVYNACITEAQSHSFSQSRGKAEPGQPTLGPATAKPFLCFSGGCTVVLNSTIDCTGGIGIDGTANTDSVPAVTQEANVTINGFVWDARRVTDRGGVGDNLLYNYSFGVTVDGIKLVSPEAPGLGVSIINLTTTNFRGYEPINTELAFSGSTSASNTLIQVIDDYPGITGNSNGVDMTSATNNAVNTATLKWRNSSVGTQFTFTTQDPGLSLQTSVQTITATLVGTFGASLSDAVIATQDVNGLVYQAAFTNGTMTPFEVVLGQWTPPGGATAPLRELFNPSGTDNDLWSFYVYALFAVDNRRIDTLMRILGGKLLEFTNGVDLGITAATRTEIENFPAMEDLGVIYDRQALHKITNVQDPSYDSAIAVVAGQTVDFISNPNIILSIDAAQAWLYDSSTTPDTITLNPSTAPNARVIGATTARVLTPGATSINTPYPFSGDTFGNARNISAGDFAYLLVGHPESEDNTYSVPTGFVSVVAETQTGGAPSSTPGVDVYRRLLDGTESGNITTVGTFSSGHVSTLLIVRDADPASPEDAAPTIATGATGNPNPASITTTTPRALVIALAIQDTELSFSAAPTDYASLLAVNTPFGGSEGARPGSIATIAERDTVETFNVTQLTTQTITLPTYIDGDVVTLIVANVPDGTAAIGTITAGPTGFTQVANDVPTGAASDARLSQWLRVMDGTEGATVPMTTSTIMSIGVVATSWIDVDNASPQDATAPNISPPITLVSPAITTATNGAVVIRSVLIDAAPGFTDGSIPAGHTLLGTIVQNPPSNGMNLGAAFEVQATAGNAGTATWTGGGTEEAVAGTFALRPATLIGTSLDGMSLATANRKIAAQGAENPSAFATDESTPWATVTLAIRESTAGGSNELKTTPKFNALQTGGLITIDGLTEIESGMTLFGNVLLTAVRPLTGVRIVGDLSLVNAGTYPFTDVEVTGDTTNQDGAGNAIIDAVGTTTITSSTPGNGNGQVLVLKVLPISILVTEQGTTTPLPEARVFIRAAAGGGLAVNTPLIGPVLVDASGQVNTTLNITVDQPFVGLVAEYQAPGLYVPQPISGTISSTTGLTLNVGLVRES